MSRTFSPAAIILLFFLVFLHSMIFLNTALLHAGQLFISSPFGPLRGPAELVGTTVEVHVDRGIARIILDQTFYNPHSRPTEGWYVADLPPQCWVTGYALWENGKRVPGKMLERGEAKRIYRDIVSKMIDPGLAEVQKDQFCMRVFPIPGEGEKRIAIEFTALLSLQDGEAVLTVPFSALEPETGKPLTARYLAVDAEWKSPRNGDRMTLTTPAGITVADRGRITERFADVSASQDLELRFKRTQVSPISAVFFRHPQQGRFLHIRLVPKVSLSGEKRRIRRAIAIDTSGSMRGEAVTEAIRCCRVLKKQLPSAVVVDGSGAMLDIRQLEASSPYGPSDISGLMEKAREEQCHEVLLLTDGDIRELHPTGADLPNLYLVRVTEHRPTSLVYELIRNGQATLFEADDLDKLVRQLEEPSFRGVTVSGDGIKAVYPAYLPVMLPGREYHIFAACHGSAGRITIQSDDGLDITIPFAEAASGGTAEIRRVWAIRHVQQLLVRHFQDPDDALLRAEIIRLCLENSITSPLTAFLAVPPEIARKFAGSIPGMGMFLAVPSFNRARIQARYKACLANMRVIEGAIDMYEMDHDGKPELTSRPVYDLANSELGEELTPDYMKKMPKCRMKGKYIYLGPRQHEVICSVHGGVELDFFQPDLAEKEITSIESALTSLGATLYRFILIMAFLY